MKRRVRGIRGHIDRLDADGVTGWAFSRQGEVQISLTVGGERRQVQVDRQDRPDVAAIYGPDALHTGFFIKLSDLAPHDQDELQIFLLKIAVQANGKTLSASRDAKGATLEQRRRLAGRLKQRLIVMSPKFRSKKNMLSSEEYETFFAQPSRLAKAHGENLRVVKDLTKKISAKDILAFITVRNDKARIPYFLEYYRRLGIGHFLFVDNDSTDGLSNYLQKQPDCSVWHTTESYKDANCGMHWLNYLLQRHGVDHWCLTIDSDELLVFPHCEDRNLHELTEFLTSERQDHFFCVTIDMYSDHRICETFCALGQNPLEVAPYFDSVGYTQQENFSYGETQVQGGPRRRVFFREEPEKAPAINKTPLVKWGNHHNYLTSTHVVAPKSANAPHKPRHLSPTGCLLRFKFMSVTAQKAKRDLARSEEPGDSIEYTWLRDAIAEARDTLFFEKSIKYTGWRQLRDMGFLTAAQWF